MKGCVLFLYVPFRKWQNYRDRHQIRNCLGLEKGTECKSTWRDLGGVMEIFYASIVAVVIQLVYLCHTHQTLKGVNSIVHRLCLNKHDFMTLKRIQLVQTHHSPDGNPTQMRKWCTYSSCELGIQLLGPSPKTEVSWDHGPLSLPRAHSWKA